MKLVISLILLAGLTSCNRGPLKLEFDEESFPRAEEPRQPEDHEKAEITFAAVNEAVFSKRCNKCHGSETGDAMLVTEQDYLNQLQLIKDEVINKRTMPKRSTLSVAEYELVKSWVDDVLN